MSLLHRLKPLVKKAVTAAGLVRRPMTLGVRVLVRDERGIFLIRHTYLPGWYLPGGGVDPGESLPTAARRELAEEGGLAAGPLVLFGLYHNARVSRRDHVALYLCDATVPIPGAKVPNAEIAEVGFFAPGALPADTTAATRRRIAEVTAGVQSDEVW